MSQADTLLRGILDEPRDEARRLILADWLEEQGDPANAARAELLRLQCAWAQMDELDHGAGTSCWGGPRNSFNSTTGCWGTWRG
jgi:uncharacterized protein (TIGR02996 family)